MEPFHISIPIRVYLQYSLIQEISQIPNGNINNKVLYSINNNNKSYHLCATSMHQET